VTSKREEYGPKTSSSVFSFRVGRSLYLGDERILSQWIAYDRNDDHGEHE
jgi:hypothetical protein